MSWMRPLLAVEVVIAEDCQDTIADELIHVAMPGVDDGHHASHVAVEEVDPTAGSFSSQNAVKLSHKLRCAGSRVHPH